MMLKGSIDGRKREGKEKKQLHNISLFYSLLQKVCHNFWIFFKDFPTLCIDLRAERKEKKMRHLRIQLYLKIYILSICMI